MHAGLRLLAEPLERRPEQWGEEPGRPFEGELGCVDHLGAGLNAAEGHGVDGGERLVLPLQPDALTGDELMHDVSQLGLPAEERGGVEVSRTDASVAEACLTTFVSASETTK